MSRFLSFLFFSLFFLISEGREILLPQTPVSAYEDTESSVSAQLPALDENDREFSALLQIVDTPFLSIAATRPNTALALWGRARPAGHPAARHAA